MCDQRNFHMTLTVIFIDDFTAATLHSKARSAIEPSYKLTANTLIWARVNDGDREK